MKARRKKGEGKGALCALRGFFLLSSCLLPFFSPAQAPDVRARVDISLSIDYRNPGDRSLRLYTPLGRPSVVALTLGLESGFNVVIAERIQRLPGDADGDIFDEAYIEDPGIWRVGKQYLPFGTGRLLRESAVAARIDSNLIAENLPVSLAGVQTGGGRQNGVLLRVGRSVGASVAYGEHFGIAGTSLGVVRHPDEAPGRNGGWKQVFGFDASRRLGKLALSAEFAALGGGPDRDLSVFDFEANFFSDNYRAVGLGYSRASGGRNVDIVRLFGRVHAARSLDLEPLVRFQDGELYDASITLRLRL